MLFLCKSTVFSKGCWRTLWNPKICNHPFSQGICCNNNNLRACCRTESPICYAYSRRSGWQSSAEDINDSMWWAGLFPTQISLQSNTEDSRGNHMMGWIITCPAFGLLLFLSNELNASLIQVSVLRAIYFRESEPCALASLNLWEMREYTGNHSWLERAEEELSSGHLGVLEAAVVSCYTQRTQPATPGMEERNWGLWHCYSLELAQSEDCSAFGLSFAGLSSLSKYCFLQHKESTLLRITANTR